MKELLAKIYQKLTLNNIMIFFLISLFGVYMIYTHATTISLKDITPEQLSANPELLNGKTLKGSVSYRNGVLVYFKDLHIENITLKDVTFEDVILDAASFKNVIFDNCTFSGFHVEDSIFERVWFNGGIMKPSVNNFKTRVEGCRLKDVFFDGTHFNGAKLAVGGGGGIIKFKNTKRDKTSHFGTRNSHLILENIQSDANSSWDNIGEPLSLHIKNSKFTNGGIIGGGVDSLYIENSELSDVVPAAKQGVITNCIINGLRMANGVFYLVNNTYGQKGKAAGISIVKRSLDVPTHAYILGDPNKVNRVNMDIGGGQLFIIWIC
ncbi:hypothetical protein [Desulfovibrio litoralis]|uniref:Pentapeptide repeat-containing protein n=1 Tax=Desulfovibrio litoralis DSM 11393 TaxID=1121455 RepID=A0A1M7TL99_9BACT|nr:hypothetical protein [Desulfovibrio litoralis]SHN71485.1 hypothetical protein SAMN02745728_02195 [Desulfovibrio litoralis DSM 11393]